MRAHLNMSIPFIKTASKFAVWSASTLAFALPAVAEDQSTDSLQEVIQIFGDKNALKTATGSGFVVDETKLEQFEFDDIHRVLQGVPGVYIREEDGYGLRPNIGLRGATSERSSKIALMEDGVLIAPAPYSAPAAYYFPNVSRMTQVEVFKGPSAISYGPNTVGGAINMLSRPVSNDGGELDVALGQQQYGKAHGHYTKHIGDLGVMIEGLHLRADGFKSLPNDDNTGFSKNEVLAKVNYALSDAPYNQQLQLKVGYSDEVSYETYLGLTDEDFAADPYQRYAASQNDKFDWEHLQLQADHYIELSPSLTLLTQVYRKDFNRDWDRLDSFESNRSISSILASPDVGLNSRFLSVLKGEEDSFSDFGETLVFTLNDRTFYSQGIQSKLSWDTQVSGADVTTDFGLRVHQDQVERLHRARYFDMLSGELVLAGRTDEVLLNNKENTTAIAAYVNSKVQYGDLHTSIGMRIESIDGESNDLVTDSTLDNSDTVFLPGIGMFYQVSPELGILAGVNKGFVPNSPGEASDIKPEESWNYEFGLRAKLSQWQLEAIGFYNDYSNLKANCTLSSGCTGELGTEFNGGEVEIYGAELSAQGEFALGDFVVPVSAAYTYTQSEFQTSFDSSFSQWGNIVVGDALPYLPENQFNLQVGLAGDNWQVDIAYKYIDEMSEAAGTGTDLDGLTTSSLSQFDFAAWYQINSALRIYSKLDNLTDEVQIVSRRPFGARPNKPRQFVLGAKYAF